MDTKFQTSFIPKKPLVPTLGPKSSKHVSFISIIIVFIFLLSLLAAGGVFLYKQFLKSSITQMETKLAAAEAALDPALINEWVRLDKRIESGKELLNVHLALSSFFTLLQEMTLTTVRFKNFSYIVAPGQKIAITMDGEADSFAAVALQSDEFAKQAKYMSNQLFSNINLDPTGTIIFRFTATIDPQLILYKKSAAAQPAPAEIMPTELETEEVPATSTTTP
jgi:hypothetical protein